MKYAKFRKKQEIVEAVQLSFENCGEVKEWVGFGKTYSTPPMRAVTGISFAINLVALFGDWILKDEEGELLRVVKPDIFEKTYEKVGETTGENEAPDTFPCFEHNGKWFYSYMDLDGYNQHSKAYSDYEEAFNAYVDWTRSLIDQIKQLTKPQSGENEGWVGLVEAYDNYITVLINEINDLIGMASIHGWQSRNVELGEQARNRIAELKSKMIKL